MAGSTRHIEPLLPSGPAFVLPVGIASGEALGTPTVVVHGLPQTIAPTGIASGAVFGATVVHGPAQTIAPTAIASSQALGALVVRRILVIRPSGIPSGEAFGRKKPHLPTLQRLRTTTATIRPAGIPSAQAVGTPTVSPGRVVIVPVGIQSAESFGLSGFGRPFIIPKPTGTGPLPLMLIRRSGLRH